jgi:acetate kinase
MLASLGGLDAIVFTAGVGEHAPKVRAALLAPFAFLGIELDPQANAARSPRDADLTSKRSRVRVLVIPAREEWAIARSAAQALAL